MANRLSLGIGCFFGRIDNDLIPSLPRWFYHDAAAAVVADGEVVGAVEEERLNRIKHTNKFTAHAIRACLELASAEIGDVDDIAFFFEERHTDLELDLLYAEHPHVPRRYTRALLAELFADEFGHANADRQLSFVQHHLCHATATFHHSGFDSALTIVIDGNGENESISIYEAAGDVLHLLRTLPPSKSPGHFYSESIRFLGYSLFDEYKVMGLAPHGDPARFRPLFQSLVHLRPDGDYDVDVWGLRREFAQARIRPRHRDEPFDDMHIDFAAALQETLEEVVLHVVQRAQQETGAANLCLAGGVAHNCTMNGHILDSEMFDSVFVDPASHDSGAAVGAALYMQRAAPRARRRRLSSVYWGPGLGSSETVRKELRSWESLVEIEEVDDPAGVAARALAGGAVIGWAQGRSEFGPRALGNRSILADPRPVENKDRINDLVKKREAFRPFAPTVLASAAAEYFEIPATEANLGFMVFVIRVRADYREILGAVTHVDGTARVQVIDAVENPQFAKLLESFAQLSGVPIVLNTSFNNYAEPIVQSVHDALTCFLTTGLDGLFIDRFLVTRGRDDSSQFWSLVPGLHSAASLVALSRGINTPVERRVEFAYTGGRSTVVSDAAFSVLRSAGRSRDLLTVLADCGVDPSPDLEAELRGLWEQRLIGLRPTGATTPPWLRA